MNRLGRLTVIGILGLILSMSLNGWLTINAKQPIDKRSSELVVSSSELLTIPSSELSLLRTRAKRLENSDSAIALVQAGKQHYHAGKFSDAAKALQQAAEMYGASQDVIKQAQALSLLSLAYQELGQFEQAEATINSSLSLLETVAPGELSNRVRAQVLNRQGRLFLARGKTEQALENFEKTELLYKQAEDKIGVIGSQINQAQAVQNLGFYRRAQKLFTQIENKLETEPD